MNNEGNLPMSVLNRQEPKFNDRNFCAFKYEKYSNIDTVKAASYNPTVISRGLQRKPFPCLFLLLSKRYSIEMLTNEFNDDVLLSCSH